MRIDKDTIVPVASRCSRWNRDTAFERQVVPTRMRTGDEPRLVGATARQDRGPGVLIQPLPETGPGSSEPRLVGAAAARRKIGSA